MRLAGLRVEEGERAAAFGGVVLDQGEEAGERAAVAGEEPLDEILDRGHGVRSREPGAWRPSRGRT